MTGELRGVRALVTGASGGIGAAIARAFASEGAHVIVHGRDPERTRQVAAEVRGDAVLADLGLPGGASELAAHVLRLGDLDVLVNNAGFETDAGVEDLTDEVLGALFRVNLFAPITLVRELLGSLSASGRGAVINVTSIHESVPVAGNGGYAAAKAALASFTRTAAIELGPRGVRINNLAPGAIETEMNRHLIAQVGAERFARWIPLGGVGRVEDVAGAAVFLASSTSRYVTGTTLTVDGGYSHHLVRYTPDPG